MATSIIATFFFAVLLVGGLIVPGWLLGRVLRTPAGPTGALLGSAAIMFNLVLLLDAAGRPLDLIHLLTAIALVCLLLALLDRKKSVPANPSGAVPRTDWRWQQHHWLFIPVVVGVAAMTVRITLEPLSGWDAPFRWDFLARQIVRLGSLSYYPAVTSGDFLHYGWCDGIAPLVSSLYAWTYFSLGRIEPWATTPVVLIQGLLLFHLVWLLANRRHGPAAAAAACAILATSAAFLWGVAMGQETGLTALSLVAMFWFFEQDRVESESNWLVWAGLAAGLGALAREYGLLFVGLGGLTLIVRRSSPRRWLIFTGTWAVVALPWYLRNWIKTGNPLYSHELGSLFPTNFVYDEYNRVVTAANGVSHQPALALVLLSKYLALYAIGPLAIGLLAGLQRWRESGVWLIAMVAIMALWLWSIGLTSGGYVYSLRVLTPAIALGAALSGASLVRIANARHRWILALILTAASLDAGCRSLFLPFGIGPLWEQKDFLSWRESIQNSYSWRASLNWPVIIEAAEQQKNWYRIPRFMRS